MVKAGEFDNAMIGVSHASSKEATHSDKHATEMDVTLLKEQYRCIRKKLRTHVVWFKTANNEEMSGKPLVTVVSINQNVRKAKAFEVEMPFKEIQFHFPGNLQDYESPWHTHLGIYHSTQTEHRNTGTAEEIAKTMDSGEWPSPTADPSLTKDISPSCQQLLEEQAVDTSAADSQSDVPDRTSNCCLGDSLAHRPRKSLTPAIQTGQQSLVAYKPPSSTKLLCYPFPQKKCPKKSEAARRLGLYATR
ncbi:uncharacterized protein C9orf152-like [Polyodon spathula]|uniref:uncharacterized protein C9orf152-like n=1 Tax=Polyodon spathula TaxID=7913 RepID=UPI001B7EB2E0|nr:uncharacterized protein C9orf152-like [Polyodon spathula]